MCIRQRAFTWFATFVILKALVLRRVYHLNNILTIQATNISPKAPPPVPASIPAAPDELAAAAEDPVPLIPELVLDAPLELPEPLAEPEEEADDSVQLVNGHE